MFIKKTWHFLSNFTLHSHVYWAKLISTMQIIVKYARLCKYSWNRNSIKTVGRNRTNLDLESKEIKSTWLSNGEMMKTPHPVFWNRMTDRSNKKSKGQVQCPHGAQTSLVSLMDSQIMQWESILVNRVLPSFSRIKNTWKCGKYHVLIQSSRNYSLHTWILNVSIEF